jgi:hypothetical protein
MSYYFTPSQIRKKQIENLRLIQKMREDREKSKAEKQPEIKKPDSVCIKAFSQNLGMRYFLFSLHVLDAAAH